MDGHIHYHKKKKPVRVTILTVSDTRDEQTDKSGKLIKELLEENGHIITEKTIVKDEQTTIYETISDWSRNRDIEVILINGGTGIAKRDVTCEVIEPMFNKTIPGFGELFRMLSFTEDIGSAAMLSRAVAGTLEDKVIFSMPGSTGAVRLAMTKLILPELEHVVFEMRK